MKYLIENHTGNHQYYTRQQVWDWLKAEKRHRPTKDEQVPVPNRVMRRRMFRSLTRMASA